MSKIYVFASPKGKQLRERLLLKVCKRIGEQAELTCRMFLHKFRHTFATYLVLDGVPLEDIKVLLGHSSIKETEIYAHHRPDDLHHQVRRLDGLLSRKKGQQRLSFFTLPRTRRQRREKDSGKFESEFSVAKKSQERGGFGRTVQESGYGKPNKNRPHQVTTGPVVQGAERVRLSAESVDPLYLQCFKHISRTRTSKKHPRLPCSHI
ncbi:MAG: tyrosine-type recombinase/integrase [Bacteroidetes bacterium]|nr:tyrosine-type recombinase/integrase [Bacteroidota bacterium]